MLELIFTFPSLGRPVSNVPSSHGASAALRSRPTPEASDATAAAVQPRKPRLPVVAVKKVAAAPVAPSSAATKEIQNLAAVSAATTPALMAAAVEASIDVAAGIKAIDVEIASHPVKPSSASATNKEGGAASASAPIPSSRPLTQSTVKAPAAVPRVTKLGITAGAAKVVRRVVSAGGASPINAIRPARPAGIMAAPLVPAAGASSAVIVRRTTAPAAQALPPPVVPCPASSKPTKLAGGGARVLHPAVSMTARVGAKPIKAVHAVEGGEGYCDDSLSPVQRVRAIEKARSEVAHLPSTPRANRTPSLASAAKPKMVGQLKM